MELTEIILTAEDYGTAERNLLLTEEGYRRRYMLAEGEESGIGGTGWACTEAGTGVSRRAKYCESAEELHGFLTGECSGAGKEFWLDRNGSSLQCLYAAGKALYMEYGREGEWSAYMQGKTGRRAQETAGCMAGTVEPVRVLAACRKLMDLYEGDEAAEDILAGMASEILDVSPDRILELLHEHRDEIKIIINSGAACIHSASPLMKTMSSVIYIGKAVYAVGSTAEGHNIHLYVERRDAEYHCIAYNPDNKHMIGHCYFTEPLYTLDKAAAKAVGVMGIQCTDIRRIKRDAEAAGTAQEPDLKICILKALAGQVHQEDCESETIHNMLKIIKIL